MYVNMPTRMHTYVYVYMHCHVRVLLHLARTLTIWPLRASPSREESSGLTRSESRRCQLYTTFPAPCSSSRPAATFPQFHSAVCCPSLSPYLQHTHVFPILPNILTTCAAPQQHQQQPHKHMQPSVTEATKPNLAFTSDIVQVFGEMFSILHRN